MEQVELNDVVANGLNQLFVWFAGLEPNPSTEEPSLTIKQSDAIEVLKMINEISQVVGYKNKILSNEDGSVSVELSKLTEDDFNTKEAE